jgi:hypothetical protein
MVAQAFCSKIDQCSPFFVNLTYGDASTCGTRLAVSLSNAITANGSGWTAASLQACAQAISGGVSCDDALGNNLPAACHSPAGQLANGTACGDSAQCSSAYCNIGTDGICGACAAARAGAGSSCYRNDDCDYGLLCGGAATGSTPPTPGTCATPGAIGAQCDARHPCKRTLACNNGSCAMPGQAGAGCTTGGAGDPFGSCDELGGVYCSAAGTCSKIDLAAPGGACGLVNNALTVCSGSGKCLPPNSPTGSCAGPAMDGARCNATNGTACLPPAVCRNGVCTVPSPATCH